MDDPWDDPSYLYVKDFGDGRKAGAITLLTGTGRIVVGPANAMWYEDGW